jgi:hypothetical protein
MIELRPITQRDAFAFIGREHRHHDVPRGGLWWHGAADDEGRLVGVAIVGRPVSRELDDGFTCEVTRLATDGAPNACSMLYGASARAALDTKGFRRILTYILASEDGASLRAAGWERLWDTKGGSWDCPSRPRTDRHPVEPKVAYGRGAWRQILEERERRAAATAERQVVRL